MAKKAKKAKKAKDSPLVLKIKKSRKEFEAAKNKYERQGPGLFQVAADVLFKKHKNLECFSWKQYTPSWNDGDSCTFGCYFDSVLINDESSDDSDDSYRLENLMDLLKDKDASREMIKKQLEVATNSWDISSLERDLKDVEEKTFEEVSEKHEIKSDLAELFGLFDESLFESMFGEGEVIIRRDGQEVNPCEHD